MAGDEAEGQFQTGLHPIVFLGALTMAGLVGLATTFVVQNNELAPATNVLVVIGGGLLVLASLLPTAMRWGRALFATSDEGFSGRIGWLRPQVLDLPWPAVADVDLDQTWLGSHLGYGTVRFLTMEQGVEGFSHVANAPALVSAVRQRLGGRVRQRASR